MPATLLGSPNTSGHMPELLLEGLREIFGTMYPLHDSGSLEMVYTVQGSRKDRESAVVMAGTGVAIPKSEGASPQYDNLQEFYKKTVTHVTYALALEFTEEAMEDNLYWDLAKEGGAELAKSMAYTRQVAAWDFWNDLTQTIYSVGGTDYQLLETAHPRVDGGTGWANTSGVATGLSMASLENRIQAWSIGMLDPRGRKYNFRPATLMVGASNEMLSVRLLTSTQRPQSADNDVNAVRVRRNIQPFMNPHLTDDGRWFLVAAKENTTLRHYDRVKAGINPFDGGDTGNRRFRARMRISHVVALPLGIAGETGT